MQRPTRNLLIVGCGDVVRRALPQLLGEWRVCALVRRLDPSLAALGVRQWVGDLDQPASLRGLGGGIDAVLHSAPPPAEGRADPRTKRLLAELGKRKSLPRRLVYISTTGVYGDCGGEFISEVRPLRPLSARAERRVDAECQLRAWGRRLGVAVSLLRAPGIYAQDRLPLARLDQGLPLIQPEEDIFTNHIHADDLARSCVLALRRGRAQRAYNVVDDTDLKMGDWFDLLADRTGRPRAPRRGKAETLAALSPMQRSFMGESRRIGNGRVKQELALRLQYADVQTALARWFPA